MADWNAVAACGRLHAIALNRDTVEAMTNPRQTQFAVLSPATRWKCLALLVTKVRLSDNAWSSALGPAVSHRTHGVSADVTPTDSCLRPPQRAALTREPRGTAPSSSRMNQARLAGGASGAALVGRSSRCYAVAHDH